MTESAARSRLKTERVPWQQADTFSTSFDGKLIVDTEGEYCRSWGKMREQALKTAGECLRDMATQYPSTLEWQLVVTNESNETVLRLRFTLSETPSNSGMSLGPSQTSLDVRC